MKSPWAIPNDPRICAVDHDRVELEEELESARAFLRRLDEPRSPVDPDKVAEQREIGKRQVRELEEQLR